MSNNRTINTAYGLFSMENLKNKTAYITGGSRGIGFGIAKELLKVGMRVAISSRRKSAANEAVEQLNEFNPGMVLGFDADVRDLSAQQEVIDEIMNKWGTLDVVVANAGIGHFGSIEDLNIEQWQDTLDVNLTGVFNTVKASINALKDSEGHLITISSLAGTNFFEKGSAYNASKFGLVGFTQAVMLDLRKYGIKVCTIMPGSVASNFNNHIPDEGEDSWKIQPEDIGELVIDLLKMNPRTLPSKIEVRPTQPPGK